VFTARYARSPYIKQIRFVFKGLIYNRHYFLTDGLIVRRPNLNAFTYKRISASTRWRCSSEGLARYILSLSRDFKHNFQNSFSDRRVINKDFFHINYLRWELILKTKSWNKEPFYCLIKQLISQISGYRRKRIRKSNNLGVESLCSINRGDYF
jgi:hypothetical protein